MADGGTLSTDATAASSLPAIYTLHQIEKAVDVDTNPQFVDKLLRGIADGFIAYEQQQFYSCPIQTMGLAPFVFSCDDGDDREYAAQTCVKSGYFKGSKSFVIKVCSGGHPMPANTGLMQVYSQATGRLEGLLMDEGILTEIRTAAVGALVAKHMFGSTQQQVGRIGMVGTGIQARHQLQFLRSVFPDCQNVLIWGRTTNSVELLRTDLEKQGWIVEVAPSTGRLFEECDLIITTTNASAPLLHDADYIEHGTGRRIHITCIGADAPGKQELDPQLVKRATLLVADSMAQTKVRGEFQHALREGLIQENSIVPLGKLLLEPTSGKPSAPKGLPSELHKNSSRGGSYLSVFDSSGVSLQDCVIAELVLSALVS